MKGNNASFIIVIIISHSLSIVCCSICLEETPNTTFEGKIILCDGLYEAGAVSSGAKGALAVISDLDSARTYSLPAVGISERQGKTIRNYIERARLF